MKNRILLILIIVSLIGIGLYFFIIKNNMTLQDKEPKNYMNAKKEIRGKRKTDALEKKKEKKLNEEAIKYLKSLKKKILEYNLPKGIVIDNVISRCGSSIFKKNNKLSIPKGGKVRIINYSYIDYNDPSYNSYQVLYKGKIYCIYTRNVKKKAKIIFLHGSLIETSIDVRYIFFPNGKFLFISHNAPFYPDDWNFEYIAGIGTYSRTKNIIKLCNYDSIIESYNAFPKNSKCRTLKRNGKIWNYVERSQRIEFRLTEY